MEKSQSLLEQRNEGFITTASQSQAKVLALEQEKVSPLHRSSIQKISDLPIILIFLVWNYLDIGGGSIFKDCIVLKAKGCNLLDSIRFTELRLCFIIKCEYLSKT